MKQINHIFSWAYNQQIVFAIMVILMALPNCILFFTEPMPLLTKVCNIVLPSAVFWLLFTLTQKPGKMFLILFIFVFFNAFQIVLLYLFGSSVIAVDMFLNVVTSNSVEIEELLGSLIPAIVIVVLIYGSGIALAVISMLNKQELKEKFVSSQRRYSAIGVGVGVVLLIICTIFVKGFSVVYDIYPVNVTCNLGMAMDRQISNSRYLETSKNFKFNAISCDEVADKEICVLVIGETARAANFGIYGYHRNTTPNLRKEKNLVVFSDALTESNTTHKSVPMILSSVSAEDFDKIYNQKSVITAFKEAGFYTAFLSNQRRNHSFIDYFGEEADYCEFVRNSVSQDCGVYDGALVEQLNALIEKCPRRKIFVVLHTYGSHFNYAERYPINFNVFKPDTTMSAQYKNREMLVNAYDNTIRYTDSLLAKIISMLDKSGTSATMIYASDHGEDIFDDSRKLFLHASPVPSYYQLHVPFIIWASNSYIANNELQWRCLEANKDKNVSTSKAIFHTLLDMNGISTSYKDESVALSSGKFKESKRWYLNDHNEARALNEIGMGHVDEMLFEKYGIMYP